jgi:acyl transferase domain-containing protein/NAD(P)H-dependent flavin oxidoreductase YrpB (nitropropane dioxygenase family)/NAD(P)-dependent dehydrogenase (short-subunit alcohol dehydrogenase family)
VSKPFGIVVLTPPAVRDPSLAIAAARTGSAVGVLDLAGIADFAAAGDAVATLRRLARGSCGIRLDGEAPERSREILARLGPPITVVVLTVAALRQLAPAVAGLRDGGIDVLGEVVDEEGARLAEEAGVSALIARGLEASGWIGEETTFVLLQRLLARARLPVWAHGGIGLHTAAGCRAAGAAGIVLDSQVALTRESPLPPAARAAIARMDGSETVCLGEELGAPYRAFSRPGIRGLQELRGLVAELADDPRPLDERRSRWRAAVRARLGWGEDDIWPIGQDAAFASGLAQRFVTVGGVVAGLRDAVREHVAAAARLRPLAEGNPLARSHGTRYPILQGPMTRVSDTAAFADSVAAGGALPFLALALLRGPETRTLLEETQRRLGDRPWGVGILGFVPLALRQEQLEAVRAVRPPFALIAGGRPDQALALEREGIPTYLHVPSPALLRMFLDAGARRFVFEGRECGGHVGPRSSFVLWNSMIDVLLEHVRTREAAEASHVVFAGGIHNALSAATVAAMAAPLADRGFKIGVLLGTAYLFTHEAVRDGAITATFQEEALRCTRTVLLESGPGHATRCVATPFVDTFERERRRLRGEGRSAEEIRDALEELNLGRLRMASKGVTRAPGEDEAAGRRFRDLPVEEQRREGMYMIGQVAALRHRAGTIPELHEDVSVRGSARLETAGEEPQPAASAGGRPCDVAVVGMACIMPKAPDLETFWANVLHKVDAITEIPPDRFDWRRYYDDDPRARDKIYSRWGGFIDPVPFDPARYGMPPSSLPSIEPLQLLTLEAVRRALDDAGYALRPFPRARTGVIAGVGGGVADLGHRYVIRSGLPMYVGDVPPAVLEALPEWTEDSFAGVILNVAAGRVANRFDLGGVNYAVDAACASSLAALYAGVRELDTGAADMMIVAAADTVQNPFGYLCFSKTRALSPRGRCRTFDAAADGIVISEGVAVVVLKRLADAERDGDRIYAVIKAVAGSSDGRDRSMTAPRPEGQMLALQRAYETAGFSPATVELIEAHGTGTVAGDRAEIESLTRVFGVTGEQRQWCAVGSVKSMIGHTKCAAGLAGLIKVAKALHHKVLPPTIGVERPNPEARFEAGPFYVNAEARPWLSAGATPRRAGVSAFGFGGTNFHAVLEEYTDGVPSARPPATVAAWPAELVLVAGHSRAELVTAAGRLANAVRDETPLRQLAAEAWAAAKPVRGRPNALTLAIVAASPEDLRDKLAAARARLEAGARALEDPRGVYFAEAPLAADGSVAFLFPGQGSQYPGMLRDLALAFAEVLGTFEAATRRLAGRFPQPLATYVYPPPWFSPEEQRAREEALKQTNVAQPALGAAGLGMARLLGALGVEPAAAAGHSYGEYVALCAAGALGEDGLYDLSEARGRAIIESAAGELGTMAAVQGGHEAVAAALAGLPDVWVANVNGPRQTVLSGTRAGIEAASARLAAAGLRVQPVAVACAFHSPLIAEAGQRFSASLARATFGPARVPVFSNVDAAPHPGDAAAIARTLAAHLVRPVRFLDQIEAMYAAGSRIFVEVGPRNILTALVVQTLEGRPFLAVPTDIPGRPGVTQLLHALGQLAAHRVALSLDRLFEGRSGDALAAAPPSPTTWLVSGGDARPLNGPVPSRRDVPAPHPAATAAPPAGAIAPPAEGAPRRPVGPPAPASALTEDERSAVMVQFERSMARFLEVQRNVMLAYLGTGGEPAAAAGSGHPAAGGAGEPRDTTAGAASEGLVPGPGVGAGAPAPAPGGGPDARGTAPAAVTDTPSAGIDGAWLQRTLVQVVADRTGYPTEMLDLDASIEADLGIDSIKRVEILGALQQALPGPGAETVRAALDTLTQAKTLRSLVEGMASLLETRPGGAAPQAASVPVPAVLDAVAPPESSAPRFLLAAVDAPVRGASRPFPAGAVLVVEDQKGVAPHVAAALEGRGCRVIRVAPGADRAELAPGRYRLPLEEPASIAWLLDRLRAGGLPIGALLYLAPLRDPIDVAALDPAALELRLRRDVRGLVHLARALDGELRGVADGFVVAVTGLDGAFGCRDLVLGGSPAQGAVVGLVKTLAVEWPTTRAKVIDVDPGEAVDLIATNVLEELGVDDGEVEVGRARDRRLVLRLRPAPHLEDGETAPALDASSVVLVTGGARGITAEIAEELARAYRPTLVLVGRAPYPDAQEDAAMAGIEPGRELKAALIADLRARGVAPVPATVEAAYRRLVRDREVRARVAAMRAAGATVVYHAVDVRDGTAFARLIDELYARHGRIDAVLHGAGVIEDKLLAEKRPESFDRVFDTKVASAFVLARALRPDSLRFLVFFTSVAGRFGNRGQGDYVAANEVLNKLARRLDRVWPARVVAINWGPWAGGGMVSPEVAQQFEARGVRLVPPLAGRRMLDAELRWGRKGAPEVLIGAGPWPTTGPVDAAVVPVVGELGVAGGGGVEWTHELSVDADRYLDDHRIDGRPVLPAAMAAELMAEVAQRGWPEWQVVELRGFRVLRGVVLSSPTQRVRVVARPETHVLDGITGLEVAVELGDDTGVAYRATVVLSSALPEAPVHELPAGATLRPYPVGGPALYRERLFHGPLFHCLAEIAGIDETAMTATVTTSRPAECLAIPRAERWLIDPVALDAAPQMALLWAREIRGMSALPSRFRALRRFRAVEPGERLVCHLAIDPGAGEHAVGADVFFMDASGRLVLAIEGLESTCSTALNRLAGQGFHLAGERRHR